MKVKELIEILKRYDPNNIVIVDGYENDFNELQKYDLREVVRKNLEDVEWYDGDFRSKQDDNEFFYKAVYLSRDKK
jgi:hypothetical protein